VTDDQLKYRIALTLLTGVGDILARNLVSYCGSVEAVFQNKKAHLEKIPGIGPAIAQSISKGADFKKAEEETQFVKKYNIRALFYLDEDYPSRLKHCPDAPVLLYYKGNADLNHQRIVSVVGTRNASDYGKMVCEKLVEDLVPHNVLVISGMAYGIDICAHKISVKNGIPTVGVMAHGLDRIYPAVHNSTARQMMDLGGLVTEFTSGTIPDRENFPKRNRIIAGLSDAVVVIEAAKKGGALITADIANSYNRDVFAVPGKLDMKFSEGCNNLIKTNRAHLLESAADISYIMRWDQVEKKTSRPVQKSLFVNLNNDEKIIIETLTVTGSLDIDSLTAKVSMPLSKVSAVLLGLEFSGYIRSLPGKVYQII
jgi:DNA processing protein